VGCPKPANRSQPLVGQSSPYCEDMWTILPLTAFFPIVDKCLSGEDIARQSCAKVRRWRFFASCICSEPRAAVAEPSVTYLHTRTCCSSVTTLCRFQYMVAEVCALPIFITCFCRLLLCCRHRRGDITCYCAADCPRSQNENSHCRSAH